MSKTQLDLRIVIQFVLSFLLGMISAFCFFALAFNGAWGLFALECVLVTAASSVAGKRIPRAFRYVAVFFIPYLVLIAVLIQGAAEHGGWMMNLSLLILTTALVWAPAPLARRYWK